MTGIPALFSATLEAARLRADKELSHLTAQRRNEGDPSKSWVTEPLFAEIKSIAENFAGKASAAKLHPDVRELVTAPEPQVVQVIAAHSHSTNVTAHAIVGRAED